MDEFAEYILNEDDLISKIEILYFLAPKLKINFDKTTVFKTEVLRMFLKYSKIEVDENLLFTAMLLCNCKKVDNMQNIKKLQTYAKDGAEYLEKLGFDERFCRICEGVNRYSKLENRESESDIIELVDNFGGMLIDRPERVGFEPDEAMVLIEYRNLKNQYNRYLKDFKVFVEDVSKIEIHGAVNTTVFARLQKLMRETSNITQFAKKIALEYMPVVDNKICELIGKCNKNDIDVNRALFTPESKEKILKHLEG